MNVAAAVVYVYGWLFACIAAAMVIPLCFALVLGENLSAQAFFVTASITGFLGVALIFALKGQNTTNTRRQSLFLLGTLWFILPVIAAFPFYLAQTPNDIVRAYFEAVSGFTTTGATIFVDLSEVPRSIIVWRAVLQWIGGLITLLTLVAILAPVIAADDADRSLHQVKQTLPAAHRQFIETLPTLLPIYGAITAACFISLIIARIPAFDAFCLSLSTVSTGGFMPRPGTISLYGSPAAELVLSLFMFLSAVSVLWVRQLIEFKWRHITESQEPIWIAGVIIFFGVVLGLQLIFSASDFELNALYQSITLGLATSASLISTTGFVVSERTGEIIPYMILLLLCLIGGGRLSTAGGLKFFRLFTMFKQANQELKKLVFPHGVTQAGFDTKSKSHSIIRSVWANFALVVMALWLLTACIAISGLPLSASLLASVSALSNIGPAYIFVPLPELVITQSYAAMPATAHVVLSFGMILGRIEILALLSLLNIAYWRS